MAFFPVFTLFRQLAGALVIYGNLEKSKGYVVAFYSQWPFSFVPILVAPFLPESPAYYVRKGDIDKPLSVQARLDPPGTDIKAVVQRLQMDIQYERETDAKSSFFEYFHRRNIRRTLIVMWANSLTAVFCLQLLPKASYFLQIVGVDADSSVLFLILGIVLGLLANMVSVWVMVRVG